MSAPRLLAAVLLCGVAGAGCEKDRSGEPQAPEPQTPERQDAPTVVVEEPGGDPKLALEPDDMWRTGATQPGGAPESFGTTEVVKTDVSCASDADCVPAQCCHPTTCVAPADAPACDQAQCTADCRGGTMDCYGGCACQEGHCVAMLWTPPS